MTTKSARRPLGDDSSPNGAALAPSRWWSLKLVEGVAVAGELIGVEVAVRVDMKLGELMEVAVSEEVEVAVSEEVEVAVASLQK